ncbi:hypothetical protein SAY87_016884 [Trapa incisa]|uniref:Uncharacterized protein n=1 Tax=Trapa incisa TaxID=236973 RepID=A0AAN7L215_9MYRT|nr:hypothetical protein SAY87_016884 [Trapa incisa]
MLDHEQKQMHRMQQPRQKWRPGNRYYYVNETLQMQPCFPQAQRPKMHRPDGYPEQKNRWIYLGQHGWGGEMWHANGGTPNAAQLTRYHGGGYNARSVTMKEVMEEEEEEEEEEEDEEEEGFHKMKTRPSGPGVMVHEMHLGDDHHGDWADHGVSMGSGPGYSTVVMGGYKYPPRAEWVPKNL